MTESASLTAPASRPRWRWLMALLVGGVMFALSEWLTPTAAAPFAGHGERFAEMASDPFRFEGPFPQRLLWPLGAWLFGLLGGSPLTYSQLCSAALLAVVYWFAHRRTGRVDASALCTAAVAVSGAVQVYKSMACLSDPLTLLLMVLLVEFVDRPRVFWPLVLLSALSHELVFFFSPWLLYLRRRAGGEWARELLLLAAVLGAYLLFRSPMASSYGVSYYVQKNFWLPWLLPALWALWGLVAAAEFGPLLLLLGPGWSSRAIGGRAGAGLYLIGGLTLMLLAYDVMRFAAFLFLPVLLGGVAIARTPLGRCALLVLVVAAAAMYPLTHPVASEQGGRAFAEIAAPVFARIAPHATQGGPVPAAPAFEATGWMFAQWPWTFVVVTLCLVAVVLSRPALRWLAPDEV